MTAHGRRARRPETRCPQHRRGRHGRATDCYQIGSNRSFVENRLDAVSWDHTASAFATSTSAWRAAPHRVGVVVERRHDDRTAVRNTIRLAMTAEHGSRQAMSPLRPSPPPPAPSRALSATNPKIGVLVVTLFPSRNERTSGCVMNTRFQSSVITDVQFATLLLRLNPAKRAPALNALFDVAGILA